MMGEVSHVWQEIIEQVMPSGAQEGATEMTEPKYGDLNHGETPETVEANVVMGAQLRAIVRSALLHAKNKLMPGDYLTGAGIEAIDEELAKWPLSAEPEDTLPQWLYWRFGRHMARRSWTDSVREWSELSKEDAKFWEHEAAAVRRAVGRGGFKSARKEPGMLLSTPINELQQLVKETTEVKSVRPLDLKNTETLSEAIAIAVGAASTCWTNMSGAGVFKSEEALDIATQLGHHFHKLMVLMNGQLAERHQKLGDLLQKYFDSGVPMISVRQAQDVLCGRSNPEEYESALQPRPAQYKDSERVRCWCGGEVGERTPGDENGLGCMRSITHNWKGVGSPAPRTPGFDGPEGTEWPGGKAHG